MRDKLIYVRDKLNNNSIIYFFVGLSIILSFYPISSGSSIIGYFALIYVMFNYKDLSVNKIFIAVSLFSCWLLFSCLMTHNEFNNNDSRFWIKELRFFLMFLMLSIMLTKMSFKKFFDMYLITGAVFTFLGYVEVFSGNSLDSFFRIFRSHAKNLHLYFDDSIPRLLSISRNADPNFVAFIIAVLFISATIIVLSGWLKNKHISKLYIFLSLFFGIALLLTGSRGGVLVALFSLIFTSFIVAKTSYNTKIYKALIFIGGAFILILLCFNFLFPDNIFIIKLMHLFDKNTWKIINGTIGTGNLIGYGVELLILSLATSFMFCMKTYSAMSLGHLVGKHRLLSSVAFYLGLDIVERMIFAICMSIGGKIFSNQLESFFHILEQEKGVGYLHLLFLGGIVIVAIVATVYFFIAKYILDRKLNLE